jgi:MOSC domain-containing protein YiiM
MTGILLGIARHDRPRGPIETVDHAEVSPERGIHGDFRGAFKPGGRNRRQVTVMTRAAWDAAMAELLEPGLDWSVRRVNLLVDAILLPETPGAHIVFAGGVTLEITGECDPCSRMEEIAAGLKGALTPDWRGGVTTRVIAGGGLAIGDDVRIELP